MPWSQLASLTRNQRPEDTGRRWRPACIWNAPSRVVELSDLSSPAVQERGKQNLK